MVRLFRWLRDSALPWMPRRLRAALRDRSVRMLLLGAAAGAVGGLAAGVFDFARLVLSEIALGTTEPSLGAIPWWRALLLPVLGGAAASTLLWIGRATGPTTMSGLVEVVQLRGGQLRLRDGLLTGVAAALSLGTGHSGGREAPVASLSAAAFSSVGKGLHLRASDRRVLVACAAAAGISASFNTPLGSAALALEVLLGSFALQHFGPVVSATVVGTLVGQALLGDRVAFHVPAFVLQHPAELLAYAALGIVCGGVASAFAAAVSGVDRLARRWLPPVPLRGALGGLVVGILGAAGLRGVMGTGYGLVDRVLADPAALGAPLLLALLGGKLIATSASYGGRAGVGLFSPMLFVGAVAGAAFGLGLDALGLDVAAGSYGLVAMGAVSATVLRAPLAMVLVLFELTGSYAVVPTTLVTVAVALIVGTALSRGSLHEKLLAGRGVPLHSEVPAELRARSTGELMVVDGLVTVPVAAALEVVVEAFQRTRADLIWVVDDGGGYVGAIDIQDVLDAMVGTTDGPGLVQALAPVRADQPVGEVLERYLQPEVEELPVVDGHGRLVGVLREAALIGAVSGQAPG